MAKRIVALFDIDGTLIITGGRAQPPGGWLSRTVGRGG
jgi:hypothetical protein